MYVFISVRTNQSEQTDLVKCTYWMKVGYSSLFGCQILWNGFIFHWEERGMVMLTSWGLCWHTAKWIWHTGLPFELDMTMSYRLKKKKSLNNCMEKITFSHILLKKTKCQVCWLKKIKLLFILVGGYYVLVPTVWIGIGESSRKWHLFLPVNLWFC